MNVRLLGVVVLGLLPFSLSAQNPHPIAEETFENKVSSATVYEWFGMLEREGYVLSYNASSIDLSARVTLKQAVRTIDAFLRQVLEGYAFTLRFSEEKKIQIQIQGQKKVQLSGKVSHAETGEILPHFTMTLTDQKGKKYTVTDYAGEFAITLPAGTYTAVLPYLGFSPYVSHLDLTRNRSLNIQLSPTTFPMKEVVVKPSPFLDDANYHGTAQRLSVGHQDPMASVAVLPGVAGSPNTGNFYVNGGDRDENQILLDGIPVYHSHHNNSLVALFNGDAVQRISFYDSFIPAQYEGRLSSVTDIRLKSGDSLRHHQSFNWEMPSVSATFEGPVVKNKLTYLLSGRHSWLDAVEKTFHRYPGLNRSFADLTGKVTYYLSPQTTIHGVVYRSNDVFNDSTEYSKNQKILQWRGGVYSLGLKTVIGRKIQNSSHLGYSEYENKVFAPAIGVGIPFYIKEGMHRFNAKTDFRQLLDKWVELSYGLKFSQEAFNLLASKDTVENNRYLISQISAYANTRLRLTQKLMGSVALNVVSYLPQNSSHFISIQPRFTLKYLLDDRNTFSLDFSRMEQFYHNICLDQIPVPSDFRMPSIKGFQPSSSLHTEGGWRHVSKNWFCSLSAYYKRRYHILGVRRIIDFEKEEWEQFIMQGNAHSGGLKFRFSAQTGRWATDLSYAFSRSMEWFDAYDNGKKHPTLHDLPHTFNWGTSYWTGVRSFFTVGGYVQSGYFTNEFVDLESPDVFYQRSERGKCNYRLDLNFSSAKKSRKGRVELRYKFGLYNVVGHPREEEVIDLYSLDTHKHALPYFVLNLAF